MKTAGDEVNARTDCGSRCNDLVDAGMRTANHDNQSVGRVNNEGEFAQFECARLIRDKCDQMDVRCDVHVLVYQFEISARPGRAEAHNIWWQTVVVPLLWWERWLFTVEAAGQIGAIDSKTFLRRINGHAGIHPQYIRQSSHVIPMTMRHNHEIQFGQVDSFCLCVLLKDVWFVSGVEQNALTAVFDQRGIAPVSLHRRSLAEGIV